MRAIDVHIHVPGPPSSSGAAASERGEAMARYFRMGSEPRTVESLNELYAELDIVGVIFGNNDWTASVVQKYPGRFIGFAVVAPKGGPEALEVVPRGRKGLRPARLKGPPPGQAFQPAQPEAFDAAGHL